MVIFCLLGYMNFLSFFSVPRWPVDNQTLELSENALTEKAFLSREENTRDEAPGASA